MRGHLTAGWEPDPQETRIHSRYETSQLVEVLCAQNEIIGRMENLSCSGARVQALGEHDLDVGNAMTVRLLDGTHLDGSVIWSTPDGFGFHFDVFLQNASDHIYFDHMGAEFCRRLLTLQTKALEAMALSRAQQNEPVVLMPERSSTTGSKPNEPQSFAPGRPAPTSTRGSAARMQRRYFPGVERISTFPE